MLNKLVKYSSLPLILFTLQFANAQTSPLNPSRPEPSIPTVSVDVALGLTGQYGVCGYLCGGDIIEFVCYPISWPAIGHLNMTCREIFFCGADDAHGPGGTQSLPCPPWILPPVAPEAPSIDEAPAPQSQVTIPRALLPLDLNW